MRNMTKNPMSIVAKTLKVAIVSTLILISAAVVFVAIPFAVSSKIDDAVCGYDNLQTAQSPDGKRMARIYEVNCGATTDFATIVAIETPNEKFHDDADVVFRAEGTHKITLRWKTNGVLTIQLPPKSQIAVSDIFRKDTSFDNITIVYR